MKNHWKIPVWVLLGLILSIQALHAGGWKWIAYGDTRTNREAHRAVLRAIKSNTPDYKFLVNVGDVTENGTQPLPNEVRAMQDRINLQFR